jgi:hypothetical protein
VGQRSLPPGRVEILVRKPITPGGLLLVRRQTALAKWVILKEKCFKVILPIDANGYIKNVAASGIAQSAL